MTDDKLFTPEFVYEICVGLAIHDFLTKDLPPCPKVLSPFDTASHIGGLTKALFFVNKLNFIPIFFCALLH